MTQGIGTIVYPVKDADNNIIGLIQVASLGPAED
jgi:hypothetical protein